MHDVTTRMEEHVDGGFVGRITLENGDEVEGGLAFDADRIVLHAAGSRIGDWPVGDFELDRSVEGAYALEVEDEVLSFKPHDEVGFAQALSDVTGPPVETGSIESADTDPRSLRDTSEEAPEDDPRPGGGGRAGLAAAVSAIAGKGEEREPESPPDAEAEVFTFTGLVGEDLLATQRDLRGKMRTRRFGAEELRSLGRKAAVMLGIVVVVAMLAWTTPKILAAFSTEASPTTTRPAVRETTTVPPTTTAPETAVTTLDETVTTVDEGATSTGFDVPAPEFVSTWNEIGGDIAPALRFRSFLPTGPFEAEFTSYLRSSGVVGPDGTMDSFTLTVDPTGPAGSDALAVQALGVMLAVVDPTINPQGRASLLGSLGLDVRRPELEGIDSEVEANGIRYRLFYDTEAVLLELTAVPAA